MPVLRTSRSFLLCQPRPDGRGYLITVLSDLRRRHSFLSTPFLLTQAQKQHHEKISFRDELIEFLKVNAIEFDERFI